jgi:hypothetical protein
VKKLLAPGLAGIIVMGMIYTHPAFAHNFGGDESASWLSKVQNLKAEMAALKMDLSDSKAVDWHVDKLGEYWNANDTKEMGERNQLLAKEIPDTIDAIATAAKQPSPNAADIQQQIDTLGGYLDESITARVDKTALQNATVQGLAVTGIISETLEDYADAIGTDVDLNNMSNIMGSTSGNMSGMKMGTSYHEQANTIHFVMDMQSGGAMQGTSDTSSGTTGLPIDNIAAYHSAQMLSSAAKNYYEKNVMSLAPSAHSAEAQAADNYLGQLVDAINNKADGNTVMKIVHLHLHTNLIPAFGLPVMTMNAGSAVPEFPLPVLLTLIAVTGVIAITRIKGSFKIK